MKARALEIADVLLLEPAVFSDERGFFFESFNRKTFEGLVGRSVDFVQDNQSSSTRGVLRGMHYQLPPMAQGKLVRVLHGSVFDVAVDIRKHSPTFGRWVGEVLSGENRRQLWIPEGFAHGFLTLTEKAEVLYKVTNHYAPELERCIRWDDEEVAIDWDLESPPYLSGKDAQGKHFSTAELFA